MLKKDREFTIKKNILDNNYQKTLALFQLFVAGLVSGMIAFSIYFHQIQSIDGLVNTIGYGFILGLSLFSYHIVLQERTNRKLPR